MTTPLRRRIRHTRRWVGYSALIVLILLALLVGIANQLLPMVERHPAQIAAWLSARVGEPVSFSDAHAEWTRRGPRFILDDLHVGQGARQLEIGRAQLQVAMYSGLLPGQPLTELKIRDLSLTLVQNDDGRWQVLGLPGQRGGGDPLKRLERFGELQIEKAKLVIHSPRLRIDMLVPRIDARIRVNGPRLRVGVSAWVSRADKPLTAVLDFQRQRREGLLWVGDDKLSLANWTPLLAAIGVVAEQGGGDVGMWGQVRDQRIVQVTVQAKLNKVRLRSSAPVLAGDGSKQLARVDFDQLQATARWSATSNGWRIEAPRLNVTRAGYVAHLDNMSLEDGRRFALRGSELDLSPLAAMLALSDRLPDPIRLFLLQSNPQAILHDVQISGQRDGPLRGSMRLSKLTLQPSGQRPGVSGLGGRLEFDERGGVLRLDSAPVRFAWPVGFRQPLDVRLTGTLGLWRNAPGWTLGSNRLHVQGDDFGLALRMEMGFQGDGSKPTLDLGANLDPASFSTAKKFWVLHKMSPSSVHWLDTALVSGLVRDGRIAIGGDLDQWPFRAHEGSFDARAHISDATLKFNPQWPAAEHMNLDIAFNGAGFSADGNGAIQNNAVTSISGGVADFREPWLDLEIHALSAGEKLRQLLIDSPLNEPYGEHLRAISISGDAAVAMNMHLPLRDGLGEKTIEGTLDLDHARLADARWDLLFTDVSGRTRFTHRGFATEDLKVSLAKQPSVFNLRVGEATHDPGAAALATLDGRFSAATLLDRYAELAWLRPFMAGSSNWKLAVRIPVASNDKARSNPSQLRLSSDLVGTTLSLPAPLKKTEQSPLLLDLATALPIEQGPVDLRLGNLMRLRGQIRKGLPLTGGIVFGEGPMPDAPDQGLAVRGNVPALDATGWIAFSGKGESKSSLHDIDVQAGQLLFIDRGFADSRLQLLRSSSATQIILKGKAIEGTVDIPGEIARGVQGKFERMYLPSDTGVGAAPVPATVEVENPSALPPLRFNIADLRIGQAQLGRAELVTSPMATGLRVDKFQTVAKNLSLDAAGEWVRSNTGTRSSFRLNFSANSLGQMLDALGYTNMVQDGKTQATLSGSWPGSPGAFSLATLSGTLKAEVGSGRLLDVEPGGSGRILGLISLAEIPRRLTLDFSDFFQKGFSFNSARGDFVFSGGTARTDNLRIDGPAAEIRVSGNTGLRDQVYDQRVEVLPKAGGILPALGLLAGGPAGAAVGAMAQAVLQRPLKQSTRVVYRVTGPWQKPQVKVIERGPDRGSETASSSQTTAPVRP